MHPREHHGVVQSVVKIDKRVSRPQAVAQFFARHNFARLLQQDDENLEGLFGEFKPKTVLAEFAGFQVDLKNSELQYSRER